MTKGPFVSLHNHTELGSPLDGFNDVDKLFDRAKELDHPAICISDHGMLTALYDSYKASKRTGVKLLPGCEMYFTTDLSIKKNYHLVLFAQNEIGYKNLLKLNYLSFKNQVNVFQGKYVNRITWEHIEKYNEGLFALTACSNGLVGKTLITEQDECLAVEYIKRYKSIFKERFFFELQPHQLVHVSEKTGKEVNQPKLNQYLLRLSEELDIPYVITCDAHYLDKEQAKYHDFMLAIKDQKSIDDPERFRYGTQDMYLKTHEEIIDFFGKDIAERGMRNTIDLMNACEEPDYLASKGPILPRFPVQDEPCYDKFKRWKDKSLPRLEEDKAYLRYKCIEGFKEKCKDFSEEKRQQYWDRVVRELKILEDKDFSSYMLIVSDYVSWARSNMPVGPSRGSGAGSLVSYLIDISTIDSIKYDLIFERFHNAQKTSFPDIDSDFADPPRVKEYLKQKYGEDRVASVSNFLTMSPKVAVKDSARSLRLGGDKSTAFKIANEITDSIPDDAKTIDDAIKKSPKFAVYMVEYPELYEFSKNIQGITKTFSTHAGAIVIGEESLYETVPLRIDPKTGVTSTQWEKKRVEDFGLVKMDILGVETLTTIENALHNIKKNQGRVIDISSIPLDDQETYEMVGAGDTVGVFQLESSLTPLCKQIKPKNIEEISAINALGRPSCQQSVRNTYIKRKLGREEVSYDHPTLERALARTNGILLYEESAMFIAQDCAGWDLNKADALRKISKLKEKGKDLAAKTEIDFVRDCMGNRGMTRAEANNIWKNFILPLSGYSFNKAHSIGYSHISYQTAWLKCHYPTEFMCALLNSENPNSQEAQRYLYECKSMGIKVTPPRVDTSAGKYVVIETNEIATGLTAIKGVGTKAFANIIENQPYHNLKDFFAKINARVVNKGVIQALAKAGAFECFGRTRKDVYENFDSYRSKVKKFVKDDKDLQDLKLPEYNEEWSRKELLLYEKEILGRTISGSLHEVFAAFFKSGSIATPLSGLNKVSVGQRIRVEAIVNSKIKEFKIKRGKNVGKKFAKYLIEDVNGDTAELTMWQNHYSQYKSVFRDGMPVKLICKVDEYMGVRGLVMQSLEGALGRAV